MCDQLSVPHYVVDLTREFEREVIEPFVEGYTQGVTPNPCVVCNPKIKFGHLLAKARSALGADYRTTGHYARCGRLRKDTQELVENCVSAAVQWAYDRDSGKWEDFLPFSQDGTLLGPKTGIEIRPTFCMGWIRTC